MVSATHRDNAEANAMCLYLLDDPDQVVLADIWLNFSLPYKTCWCSFFPHHRYSLSAWFISLSKHALKTPGAPQNWARFPWLAPLLRACHHSKGIFLVQWELYSLQACLTSNPNQLPWHTALKGRLKDCEILFQVHLKSSTINFQDNYIIRLPSGVCYNTCVFFFNWRLVTLQYCIRFAIHQYESATGIHMFLILNPSPSSFPVSSPWVIRVHQPQAYYILHQTWTGDSFLIWYYTCFNAILPNHPTLPLSHRVQKTVLYICVSFAVSHTGLSLPSF